MGSLHERQLASVFRRRPPFSGAEPPRVAFGFVAEMCMPAQARLSLRWLIFHLSQLHIRGGEGFGMPAWRQPRPLSQRTLTHTAQALAADAAFRRRER
eukprot:353901-Chlamydomonas_euryale.AAC.2